MITFSGFRQPALSGMSSLDQRAEDVQHRRHAHGRGRVEVVHLLRRGAGEVDLGAARRARRRGSPRWICAPLSSGSVNCAVLQPRDDAAHRLLGVVLHVAHVGLHHVQPELVDHLAQFLHALLVGGDLRLQVGHVLLGIARRGACRCAAAPASPARASVPRSTSLKLLICTPSSSMRVENGGMEPGVMPPMSAWWPREPT